MQCVDRRATLGHVRSTDPFVSIWIVFMNYLPFESRILTGGKSWIGRDQICQAYVPLCIYLHMHSSCSKCRFECFCPFWMHMQKSNRTRTIFGCIMMLWAPNSLKFSFFESISASGGSKRGGFGHAFYSNIPRFLGQFEIFANDKAMSNGVDEVELFLFNARVGMGTHSTSRYLHSIT